MATVKEFGALRFTEKAGAKSELCCPPYDIISAEEKENFLNNNPLNIIRLELPEQSDAGYVLAGDTLEKWVNDGILAKDQDDCLYVYEEKFSVKGVNYSFKGIVARVKLHPFSDGVVLPHEETLSKAKTDRLNLMSATGCNFSQIYSLYSDVERKSSALIEEMSKGNPDTCFTDGEGVTHSLWVVKKSDKTEALCRFFDDKKLYIADGHHRYETALNYQKQLKEQGISCAAADYIMMFLIDMENDGLVVFPTHRIVRDLEALDEEKLLKDCGENFFVEPCCECEIESKLEIAYKEGKKAFGFVGKNKTAILTLKDIAVMNKFLPDASPALKGLDVSVLHTLILENVLGIDKENMAKQINLTYTRVFDEAVSAAKGKANCAFILNPTRVEEIAAVSAAGEKMPQKSTYFYPKLITGLVMNKMK